MWRVFRLVRTVVRQRRRIRELEEALAPFAAMTSDHGSLINCCRHAAKVLRQGKWQ